MGGITLERFAALHQGGALADVTSWVHPLEEDGNVALGYGRVLQHIETHLMRCSSRCVSAVATQWCVDSQLVCS